MTFVISLFISCQKKFEHPNDFPLITIVDFKARINGDLFTAALSGAVRRNDGVISISGRSVDNKVMSFTVADSGVHLYSFDVNSTTNFCWYEDNTGLAFSTNEGNNPDDAGGNLAIIFIDSIKKTMSGTFSVKLFRQIDHTQRTITEGIFNNVPF